MPSNSEPLFISEFLKQANVSSIDQLDNSTAVAQYLHFHNTTRNSTISISYRVVNWNYLTDPASLGRAYIDASTLNGSAPLDLFISESVLSRGMASGGRVYIEADLIGVPSVSITQRVKLVLDLESYQRPRVNPDRGLGVGGTVAVALICSLVGVALIVAALRYRTLRRRQELSREAMEPLLNHQQHLERRRFQAE